MNTRWVILFLCDTLCVDICECCWVSGNKVTICWVHMIMTEWAPCHGTNLVIYWLVFLYFEALMLWGTHCDRGFLCETYPKSDAFLRIAFSIDQWKGGIVNDLLSNVNDILYNVGMLKAKLDVLGWFRKPISIKISKIRR